MISLPSLLESIQNQDLKTTLKNIQQNYTLQPYSAIKIFAKCHELMYSKDYHAGMANDIFNLLREVTPSITDSKHLVNYLPIMYHILKKLIEHQNFDIILQMENIIFPHFMQTELTETHAKTYNSICFLIPAFLQKQTNNVKKCQIETYITLCYFVLKLYNRNTAYKEKLLEAAAICCKLLHKIITFQALFTYYREVLAVAHTKDYWEQKCASILLSTILEKLLENSQLEDFATVYNESVTHLESLQLHSLLSYLNEYELFLLIICPKKEPHIQRYKHFLKDFGQMHLAQTKLDYFLRVLAKQIIAAEWNLVDVKTQCEIIRLLLQAATIYYRDGCNCDTDNCCVCLNLHYFVLLLISLSVSLTNNETDEILNLAEIATQMVTDRLHQLKSANCKKLEALTTCFSISVYNLTIRVQHSRFTVATYFTLIKYCLWFVKPKSDDKRLYNSIFYGVCKHLMEGKNYIACMQYVALYFYCFGREEKPSIGPYWPKVKSALEKSGKNNRITFVSVLEQKTDFGLLKLNCVEKVELLKIELEIYNTHWASREQMLHAFLELHKLADVKTSINVAMEMFLAKANEIQPKMGVLLIRTLKDYEDKYADVAKRDAETNLEFGALYYIRFKFCEKNVIIKNTEDMEQTQAILNETVKSASPYVDKVEENELVSSYAALNLSKYNHTILRHLCNALKSLMRSVVNCAQLDAEKLPTLYKILVNIGHEFRLHKLLFMSVQCFYAAFNVAKFTKTDLDMLNCIGYLIENAELVDITVKLVNIGDALYAGVKQDASTILITQTYLVKKCRMLLNNNRKAEALEVLREADRQHELIRERLIAVQLLVLHNKFDSSQIIHNNWRLNAVTLEMLDKQKINAYTISILLDVNEEVIRFYQKMSMPREVRCYANKTTLLTQSMVLPIRCCFYQLYLSLADILCLRFDDAQVKLDGMSDILCLRKNPTATEEAVEFPIVEPKTKALDELTNQLQEIMLDCPNTAGSKQYSASSPALQFEKFTLPNFVRHDAKCDCFYCSCVEYQICTLAKTNIDGFLNSYQKNLNQAENYFNGALNLHKAIKSRLNGFGGKFVPFEFVSRNYERCLMEVYAEVLHKYAMHLFSNSEDQKAVVLNKSLLKLLSDRQTCDFLFREALIQRSAYLRRLSSKLEPPVQKMDDLSIENEVKLEKSPSKTPESKSSRVTVKSKVELERLEFVKPKVLKPVRKFRLSPSPTLESEDEEEFKAMSKFEIFAQSGKTSARKAKSKADNKTFLKLKVTDTLNTGMLTPKTLFNADDEENGASSSKPVRKTARRKKSEDEALKSRTKLLTDKLNAGMKTPKVLFTAEDGDSSGDAKLRRSKRNAKQ